MTDAALIDPQAEIERLRAEVEALRLRAEAAEAAADHDVLTPALNRRGFVTVMRSAMAFCQRHEAPAVLLYLDLDGFKRVNDTLGHAAGDAALVHVAELLRANLRESDAVGRLGGDEFGLLMLNAGLEEGRDKGDGSGEKWPPKNSVKGYTRAKASPGAVIPPASAQPPAPAAVVPPRQPTAPAAQGLEDDVPF